MAGKVKFVVVAEGLDKNEITEKAQNVAALNPVGRIVVLPGDEGYPALERIQTWLASAGILNPGAIVLRPDGSLYDVLSIEDAKIEAIIDDCFAQASQ